ncbi:MAG: hypothetical protein ACMVP2_25555 [Imperialibacter sp.]|uniref:hypothetical protein n=1 Tax=Imperialibacter sp. TaxID=2038411 RepID=UPI003A883799
MARILTSFLFFLAAVFASCQRTYQIQDIEGLWQLETYEQDALAKSFSPVFLEINDNRSFAVSRVKGDLSGVYKLQSDKLAMYSTDVEWFNSTWSVFRYKDLLKLKGKDDRARNVTLSFTRISEVPGFEEFERTIVGEWELYKIRNRNKVERLQQTVFSIDESGNYSIVAAGDIQESGVAVINTRHRKIIFENDQTEWKAWLYGRELRLTNEKTGVEYSLRRGELSLN